MKDDELPILYVFSYVVLPFSNVHESSAHVGTHFRRYLLGYDNKDKTTNLLGRALTIHTDPLRISLTFCQTDVVHLVLVGTHDYISARRWDWRCARMGASERSEWGL